MRKTRLVDLRIWKIGAIWYEEKRSIILISILIIVSAVIYFYKPEQNNSYQLGVIISIGNKDKSNILYYNDELQKQDKRSWRSEILRVSMIFQRQWMIKCIWSQKEFHM